MELHGDGVRTESVLRTQAQQVARPLARLITDLKAAGLYDRTVIAVYTLDGSRRPAAIWRTVRKALSIPETEDVDKFDAEIDDAVALDFMLKG